MVQVFCLFKVQYPNKFKGLYTQTDKYHVFLCCTVNGYVCLVCCLSDSVCELFGETFRNTFGCGCYFVVECYGSAVLVKVLCLIDRV